MLLQKGPELQNHPILLCKFFSVNFSKSVLIGSWNRSTKLILGRFGSLIVGKAKLMLPTDKNEIIFDNSWFCTM